MKERQLGIIFAVILLLITGCGKEPQAAFDKEVMEAERQEQREDIAELYYTIYQEVMAESDTADALGVTRSIVEKIGESGYAAIDSDNQIDMEGAEQVISFCSQVENRETAQLTIIVAAYANGFLKYDCTTENGKVYVVREYYQYADQMFQCMDKSFYLADVWQYTEEGYLVFSGSAYSEESYVLTLSDVVEHAAWRVLPLDEKCRELNRHYILPVGYRQNNLFLFDWNEKDFGDLDFNDLFAILYEKVYGRPLPYLMDESSGKGAVYQIPKEEFETVIFSYFEIDSKTLQSKTSFSESSQCYLYRPRGFYEVEYTEMPYPEVVNVRENSDDTLTLTVNVIYPNENLSKVYAHEVVIRPLMDGAFVYVSNCILPSEENYGITWHADRLTEEEWEMFYGYRLPLEEKERQEAENDCMQKMELVQDVYAALSVEEREHDILPEEIIRDAAKKIAESGGCVMSAEAYASLANYKTFEQFLEKAAEGEAGEGIIYTVQPGGAVSRQKYLFDGTDMYVIAASAAWLNANSNIIIDITYTKINEWKYTEKGWFCYELCVPEYPQVTEVIDGNCMVRIRPIEENCREWSEKCLFPIGYQGNNLLCCDWDADCMEKLDYNGLYEYFYRMKYQKRWEPENTLQEIGKEDFESLMMEYLPVTEEMLQKYAGFHEDSRTYDWAALGCPNYQPSVFGTCVPEVTAIRENEDGTVTLTVDAVCEMLTSDDAYITHELTVQLGEDGSFRYLGNKILDEGAGKIPEYQYRTGEKIFKD